ncbi:MAG: hypothetical protein ACFNLM_00485 [Selenomonas noxia]
MEPLSLDVVGITVGDGGSCLHKSKPVALLEFGRTAVTADADGNAGDILARSVQPQQGMLR